MTSSIPNSGGVVSWFAGDNSIAAFSDDIVELGKGLKGFSDEVAGVIPENIIAAANAAKALAEMTAVIPDEGGMLAWFTGENSISKFADDIVVLGGGLKGFSEVTMGIVPENITAAANAAKALAEMTAVIPDQGGLIAWFTGESSISKFANQLPALGSGLKGFSDATAGIVPDSVTAAANAAKSLAEMTATLPNEGGMVAWFTGESSVAKFSLDLVMLGTGLKGFATAVAGIDAASVTAAAEAGKSLADMASVIPNEGGVVAWFTGENSISKFAGQLPKLGEGLKGFADNVGDLKAESVTAAANAAKALGEMTSVIPTEGGIKAWFTGETSIANFADKLPTLGTGLKGFANEIGQIKSPESITAAANAAKALGEMTEVIPKNTEKIVDFGDNLETFGESLSTYFESTSGISAESVSGTKSIIDTVEKVSKLDGGNIKSVAKAIKEIAKSLKELAKVPKDCASTFTKAMDELGEKSVDALVKSFEDGKSDMKDAAKTLVESFASGITKHQSKATKACEKLMTACATAMKGKKHLFVEVGEAITSGLKSGIGSGETSVVSKVVSMAKKAYEAAKEALGINSPSKVFKEIGMGVPEGFVLGVEKLSGSVVNATEAMAGDSIKGVKDSISRIADVINSDIDAQPTIRPVLDLSDVESGAGAINGMFGSSVGLLANVGGISATMNRRNQNGGIDEIVASVDKLGRQIANMEHNTYNINGVTYDDGSNISAAVGTIVRAARIERRI